MQSAVHMLKQDHHIVQNLFRQFSSTSDRSEKKRLVDTALKELVVHAALEEEFVYPALREEIDSTKIDRAKEEHHVVELLIKELDGLDDEARLQAKFAVLMDNVTRHIEKEESEILPKAETLLNVAALGGAMTDRKQELEKMMEGPVTRFLGKAMRKKISSGTRGKRGGAKSVRGKRRKAG